MSRRLIAVIIGIALLVVIVPATLQRGVLFAEPLFAISTRIAKTVTAPIRFFSGIAALREETQQLQQKHALLKRHIADLRAVQRENDLLRKQLNAGPRRASTRHLPGTVIGADPTDEDRTIVINRGSDDGIQVNDPVITPGGTLLGRITTLRGGSALVTLLTHPESRVDVRILPDDIRGVVQSHGGFLSVDLLPQGQELTNDASVVTSGNDGLYPPNLYVGTLGEVLSTEVEAFQRRRLHNDNAFESLSTVFILASL